ncbi:MAG: gamma-glutamyltransferase [Candidatus Rokubacteria bacterium]|nr:gamma-glutamyltransferase [Candidatus Rokubacteria bacterium]
MVRSRLHVTKKTPLAARGLVTAEHHLGADVGAQILARGGNAVDAAVATAFAMTVVEPFMSTIAGAGTMLIHLAKRDETVVLDFNGNAPLRAHETMYRLIGGIATHALFAWPQVEDDANVFGHRSVAVPGSVKGLALALERYGTMTLADAIAPAVKLAREGVEADWYLSLMHAKYLEELLAFPESARVYLRNGRFVHRPPALDPGDRATFPDLARSLELIGRDGPDAFYRGAIADAIVDEMSRGGGLIGKEDLAAYEVRVLPPLRGKYRGLDVAFSPGATGGITALEILNILGQYPSDRAGWNTVEGLDHRGRAARRAFLDRFEEIGDPQFVKVDWERLASAAYAKEVVAGFKRGGASRARRSESRRAEDCTTHVCAVDRQRNMVALTHTAVSLFGSRVVARDTGILLNNGMIWFDPEPGKANSIAPGKRGMVNMVPALAFRRGEPYLTVGAPGGRKIVSAIPQVIANVADGTGTLQQAIEAPRVHDEGGQLEVDDRVGDAALEALRKRGHDVLPRHETYSTLRFSRPIGIRVTPKGLEAGLDALGAAAAAGR